MIHSQKIFRLTILFFLTGSLFAPELYAQDLPARQPLSHELQTYRDSENRVFINQHQSYRFFFAGEITSDSEALSSNENPAATMLPEGETLFQVNKTDGAVISVPLVVDGTPPESELRLLNAPQFKKESRLFIGRNLSIILAASDNSSGVQQSYWAINNNPFNPFAEDNTNFDSDGAYVIYYYSVDQVGNVEAVQHLPFEVDVTGPVVSRRLEGPQQLSVTAANSSIILSATDEGSGTANIFFWFDEGEAELYSTTISLSSLEDGEHTLYSYAIDQVENSGDTLAYHFYLDRNAPEIREVISGNIYDQNNTVYIASASTIALETTDNKSGTSWLRYQVNQDGEKTYTQPIRLPETSGTYTVTYSVADVVGNISDKKSFKVYVDNNPPLTNLRFEGYYSKTADGYAVNPETKVLLDANDLESGVKETVYQLNGSDWISYSEPISFAEPGEQTITYRAADQVDNQEETKSIRLSVVESSEMITSVAAPEKPSPENSSFIKTEKGISGPHKEVFLWLSSSPSDTAEKFMLSYADDGSEFPLMLASNKENQLEFSIEELGSSYPVVIDGSAPVTRLATSDAKYYSSGDKTIFAPGVTLTLSSSDNITGVKEIYTSENGARYQVYESPLRSYYAEQAYNLRYYAVDEVGNAEAENVYSFHVDATPPITSHQFLDNFSGANLSQFTTLRISSDDNMSGVDTVFIQLNDQVPVVYQGELKLGDLGNFDEAFNTISYHAVDRVGNTEQKKQFNFKVDQDGPVAEIVWQGRTFESEVVTYIHPSTKLTLEAEDTEMEIRESWFRLNSSASRTRYESPVSLAEYDRVSVEFAAVDVLGNQGTIEKKTVIIDSNDPESTYQLTGKKLDAGNDLILGDGAAITISASDDASGVAQIRYSVNSEQLKPYASPIRLTSSGNKIIRFEAIDKVGNVETVNILNLVYDATAPEIDLSYSETPAAESAGKINISQETLITVKSTDRHTEVKSVEYKIDDEAYSTYIRPVAFSEAGNFTLTIRAEDLLGNTVEKVINVIVE